MKKQAKIAVGILAALIVISFAKDIIIKISVEKGVQAVTGLPLKMKGFKVGIVRTLVDIKGLKLYNPKGYTDKLMLDMPEIYVDYHLLPIFKGKVHLQEMRIYLKEFVVVKNKNGEVNLDSLKVVEDQKEKKARKKPKTKTKGKGKTPDIQIDLLKLKIGKVLYKDYSKGTDPVVKEYDIGIDERYENITNLSTLISLILVKSLAGTNIARLTKIDLKGLQGSISDTLDSATKAASETVAKAQKVVEKNLRESRESVAKAAKAAKEASKKVGAELKKAADDLKKKFKLPFGGDQ